MPDASMKISLENFPVYPRSWHDFSKGVGFPIEPRKYICYWGTFVMETQFVELKNQKVRTVCLRRERQVWRQSHKPRISLLMEDFSAESIVGIFSREELGEEGLRR